MWPFDSRKIAFPRERRWGQNNKGWALTQMGKSITKKLPPRKNFENGVLMTRGHFPASGCKIKPGSMEIK